MSASETIERLRQHADADTVLAVAIARNELRALLDIAEAAERLRERAVQGQRWPADREGWCCGCGGSMLGDGGPFHADACPAIALDRAIEALGGE